MKPTEPIDAGPGSAKSTDVNHSEGDNKNSRSESEVDLVEDSHNDKPDGQQDAAGHKERATASSVDEESRTYSAKEIDQCSETSKQNGNVARAQDSFVHLGSIVCDNVDTRQLSKSLNGNCNEGTAAVGGEHFEPGRLAERAFISHSIQDILMFLHHRRIVLGLAVEHSKSARSLVVLVLAHEVTRRLWHEEAAKSQHACKHTLEQKWDSERPFVLDP